MSSWVSSTLFFVRDVDAATGFYVCSLGFTLNMRYEIVEDLAGNQLYFARP